MSLTVLSYGGGVQSTALLVLACQGELSMNAALFANVGDDSEHPATLRYVREVAQPYGARHDVPVHELKRRNRHGGVVTLLETMQRPNSRSVPIPVRNAHEGAPMGRRTCTADWKIRVLGKWLKAHGATADDPATVSIGFSWDEAHRVGRAMNRPSERLAYPLLDRRLNRSDCLRIIERAGLASPPKSACWFCPFHKPSVWATMRRDEPLLFHQSADLETLLNVRRTGRGKAPVYLSRFGRPLREAIGEDLQTSFDFGTGPGETCDEGYCWT